MNNDELRDKLVNIADKKYPDIAREEEFDIFMDGVDATIDLLEKEKTPIPEVHYKVDYLIVHLPGRWWTSIISYGTEEEARLDNSDVPDDEIRYKRITTYAKKVEIL